MPLNSVPHILLSETDYWHSCYASPYLLIIFTAVHMTITFPLLKHCYKYAERERGSRGREHRLIHVDIWQKLIQHCKKIIFQLNKYFLNAHRKEEGKGINYKQLHK